MEITHQDIGDGVTLVSLQGRLDSTSSDMVKIFLQRLLAGGHSKLAVDLQHVPFIDSAGLVALVSGLRIAKENNSRLVLCAAQPQAQLVFRLTMLDRVISVHPTATEAKQSLAG
ncbi:MAG: STAS domain-containing protein [Anaerolineae bacterium]